MGKRRILFAAASAMCLLLTACGSTEIKVNDYLTTEVGGYDGDGSIGWNVSLDQLVENNHEAFGLKDGYSMWDYQAVLQNLHDSLSADFDKSTGLSNGETVKFKWDTSNIEKLESEYKIKLVTEDVDIKVSGLQEAIEINTFDKIKIQYSGTAPDGYATVDTSALNDLPDTIWCDIAPKEGLCNGDTVKVTISDSSVSNLANRGYRLTETEKTYTVEGLQSYLMSLDELPADASKKMESHGQDLLKSEIASYWDNPSDLDSITLLGNYLLTTKKGMPNPNTILVYVYEIKTQDFSYYSYVEYSDIMLLNDGTCSFNLANARQPFGSISFGISGAAFEHDGLRYLGYADLDTLFNKAVTQRIDLYDYKSTVS